MFFLRLLPFLRAAVSIPAGLAEMSVRKFTLYSAAGSLIFNAGLAYSAYAARTNPDVMAEIRVVISYVTSRWPFFLTLTFIALVAGYLLYRQRHAYRRAPQLAARHVLYARAIAAVATGVTLLGFSFLAPGATYRAVTWIAVDAGQLADQYHVSNLLFLSGIAFGAITLGLISFTVYPLVERLTRIVSERLRLHWSKNRDGSP